MRVEVQPINFRGRPVPKGDRLKGPACQGTLKVVENRLHAFQRTVMCATVCSATDGIESPLLPDLLDVELIWVFDKKIRLRGVELVDNALFGQTWDIKVL